MSRAARLGEVRQKAGTASPLAKLRESPAGLEELKVPGGSVFLECGLWGPVGTDEDQTAEALLGKLQTLFSTQEVLETADALAPPPSSLHFWHDSKNKPYQWGNWCLYLSQDVLYKDINEDKDETKFVQIILAIKIISSNIYRASLQLISVYLTVISFAPKVIHRSNWYWYSHYTDEKAEVHIREI